MQSVQSDSSISLATENNILRSVFGHMPVGINKNFNMIACLTKFNARSSIDAKSTEIWNYLATAYNLERFDELHKIPFPNNEVDFDLSQNEDFKELIEKRMAENDKNSSSSAKSDPLPEVSDDNTLSGASTPVQVTPQPSTKERKRKSTYSNDISFEKTHTSSGRRRPEKSETEKFEKNEIKHTSRSRHDKEEQKLEKMEKSQTSATVNQSAKEILIGNKRGRSNETASRSNKNLRSSPAAVLRENSTPKSTKKSSRTRREIEY